MADQDYTVFDPKSSKRIAEAVRKLERQFQAVLSRLADIPLHRTRWITPGKLTSELAPGGSATFKMYSAGASGGLSGSPVVDDSYTVVDIGMLADTVPVDSVIVAAWSGVSANGGVWIIIAYDCGA